jgi:hypothetical protein
MKHKFAAISISLLSVLLGIAYSVISADADKLKPFVHIAWAVICIGGVLSVFFVIADNINFGFLSFHLTTRCKVSIDEAEQKLVHDPELENVNGDEVFTLLNSWEEMGEYLMFMSWMYNDARRLLIELTILIAPAMLRHTHQEKFIVLGSAAYKRAKCLKRLNTAAMIAYYITHAYYSLYADLSTSDGRKWVDRIRQIYTEYPNEEIHLLLLEVEGLRFKADPERRTNAKEIFEEALRLTQQSGLAKKPNIAKMSKNIYYYLGDLAEREADTNVALGHYNQALDPTSKDIFKQLYIYNKLGQLALLLKDYHQANQWYSKQLELAEKNSSPSQQCNAHKGLAKVLFEDSALDVGNAYLHAKQALEIAKEHFEDNPSRYKAEIYEIQVLIIDISNKMYKEYCSLLHGQRVI